MSAAASEAAPLRFSGENEDGREYKRWKTWVKNKLLTLDKLPETARGAYIYTLLAGKALEAVEHLDPGDYQKKDGDQVLWSLLDKRFPQLEVVDELGEILGEVFNLRSQEGETMKQWAARASELFDRCHRKTGVQFPDEARGWLLLHRANLSEEQKAVVISRARGDLKRESIAAALRSCYPDLVVGKRRTAVALAEETMDDPTEPHDAWEEDFSDVERLLEDHQSSADWAADTEAYNEAEVAEVLAATWKERRQELNRLQKTRQFQKSKDVKRAFRVEVEEMKRHTTCNRCGRRGHWARECRAKDTRKGSSKGSDKGPPASGASQPSGAAVVEELDFIAAIMNRPTLLEQARMRFSKAAGEWTPDEVMLVSSPGFGVLDSGCGRTVVGASTLQSFEKLWSQRGWTVPSKISEVHQFKFGNGDVETSHYSVQMPVILANRRGVIRAAVIKGDAPLLVSRSALKSLGASLDFQKDCLNVFGQSVPLKTNGAGQYVVDLLSPKETLAADFTEVMTLEPHPHPAILSPEAPEADTPVTLEPSASPAADEKPLAVWTQENSDVMATPWLSRSGPAWKQVVRRKVIDCETNQVLDDSPIIPGNPQHRTIVRLPRRVAHVRTEFSFLGETMSVSNEWQPTERESRQLESQIKTCLAVQQHPQDRCLVMEVFSPPRFSLEAEKHHFRARSYDLKNGWDFRLAQHRRKVEDDLINDTPSLLILCPPCTHEGGWFWLNSQKWDPHTVLRIKAQSRSFIRWCCKLFRIGVQLGCRVVFEHPTGARTWHYPEVEGLCRRFHTVKLHMCRYGLQLPESDRYIRKSTRLLVSHEDMSSLGLTCDQTGTHQCHDVIAGSAPGVPRISTFAGAYPVKFVQAVLNTIPQFQLDRSKATSSCECIAHVEVINEEVPDASWTEILAAGQVRDRSDSDLIPVLDKLHRNLGHPPNHDLVRILRHGQASEQAIRLAKEFSCDLRRSQLKPKVPLPAQPHRITEFNSQVGLDVKHLKGWLPNQKVKALNIVDTASSFQRVIIIFLSLKQKLQVF